MSERPELTLWRVVEAIAVVLVLGAFLLHAQAVLNPVLLFVLLWAVMIPFRGQPGHAVLLSIVGGLTLAWLLAATGTLLAPFILSLVLAYILDPLADRLQRRGLSRSVSVGLIMIPAIGGLAVVVMVLLPAAIEELGSVLQATPELFGRIAQWIEDDAGPLSRVPFVDLAPLVEQLQSIDSAAIVEFVQERQSELGVWMWTGVLGFGRGIGSALTILGYVALTPVLTFYLIRDWDRITAAITDLVPHGKRAGFVDFARESDEIVSSYLRGQLTVAVTIGALTGVGLAIVSFPYAVMLGLVVAVFSVVPYLGLVLSLFPAIVIALLSGSVAISLLKVVAVYGIAQVLDGTLITPRIVGDSVGMHPVWVVLALSLGGFFFGFAGLLIGVPGAAVTKLLISRGMVRYRASDFFRGTADSPSPTD